MTHEEHRRTRCARLHRMIGIPWFELNTPNNKFIIQMEFMKFMMTPEDEPRNTWIDRQMKFLEKMDRRILKWEIKKNIKQNQLTFDETLANSEPTPEQQHQAYRRYVAMRERQGKKPNTSPGINWQDDCPPGTPYFAETCTRPRREYWWLPRLTVTDRAVVDHHIAGEIERGEWD